MLLERETVTPLLEAGPLRVTAQVVTAPEVKLVGWQLSEERLGAVVKERVIVLETPLRLAVMIAD